MILREATPNDISSIAELIRGLAEYEELAHEVVWDEASLSEGIFGEGSPVHVTLLIDEPSDTVAGFALWFQTFSTFRGDRGIWLEDLFVKPEHRGKGYGQALLKDLRDRTNGRVEWMVLDWNDPSIRFYESLGATTVPGWSRFRWLPS